MSAGEIHVGDIGTLLRGTVKENGVAVDISSATVTNFKLKPPDGGTKTRPASFETDGTDGVLIYYTDTGDLDVSGNWKIQGYVEIGVWKGHTDIIEKYIHDNLPDEIIPEGD